MCWVTLPQCVLQHCAHVKSTQHYRGGRSISRLKQTCLVQQMACYALHNFAFRRHYDGRMYDIARSCVRRVKNEIRLVNSWLLALHGAYNTNFDNQ